MNPQQKKELLQSLAKSDAVLDRITHNMHDLQIVFGIAGLLAILCVFLSSGAKAQYQRSSVTVSSTSYGSPVFINRGVVTTSPSASVNINSIRTFNRSSNINTFRGR